MKHNCWPIYCCLYQVGSRLTGLPIVVFQVGSRLTGLSLQQCYFAGCTSEAKQGSILTKKRLQAGLAGHHHDCVPLSSSIQLSPYFRAITKLDIDSFPVWWRGGCHMSGKEEIRLEGLDQLTALRSLRLRMFGPHIHSVVKEVLGTDN
jgi:hypothetical protein